MFRSIISSYYRGAHGVILMYDVGRAKTFEALEGWLSEVRSKCAESVVIVLVGNKVDTDAREVRARKRRCCPQPAPLGVPRRAHAQCRKISMLLPGTSLFTPA